MQPGGRLALRNVAATAMCCSAAGVGSAGWLANLIGELMSASSLTVVADGLTMLRLLVAVMIVPIVWSQNLALSAVLVSGAWLTDLLDGRLARAGGRDGRLGRWDLWVDTGVGVGLLIGLTGSGLAPVWLLPAGTVFLWAYLRGNVAGSMLAQLSGYVPLLVLLWARRPPGWWAPFLTATMIGVVDWRRLVEVDIPAFLGGLRKS